MLNIWIPFTLFLPLRQEGTGWVIEPEDTTVRLEFVSYFRYTRLSSAILLPLRAAGGSRVAALHVGNEENVRRVVHSPYVPSFVPSGLSDVPQRE